jgi:hypothetical protein
MIVLRDSGPKDSQRDFNLVQVLMEKKRNQIHKMEMLTCQTITHLVQPQSHNICVSEMLE